MTQSEKRDVQTQEQMWALILRNDRAAATALIELVKLDTHLRQAGACDEIIAESHEKFLYSLCDQATRKRDQGLSPLLTTRQTACLRPLLDEYQDTLWQIVRERLGLADDRPYEREDEYEPGAEEPINPAWSQFCECGKLAQVQHLGDYFCMPCRRALDEPTYDLTELNEMVEPRLQKD